MKRKRLGVIVLNAQGEPLIQRKNNHHALMPCRKGEAPDLFDTEAEADFAIKVSQTHVDTEGFRKVPIAYPRIKFRLVKPS